MSFPRYSAYKESGASWMGLIPEEWCVGKIKHTTYLKGRVGWKGLTSDEFLVDGFAHLVTGTDFKKKFIDWGTCYCVTRERYEDDPFIQLEEDDLLITKDGTIGKIAIVKNLEKPSCLNSGVFLVRPLRSYVTQFLYWVLSSDVFKDFVDVNSQGSTIQHLYQNVFENFTFPLPDLNEQANIAQFLDHETAKIDALIAEQEKLIALLKEKRQAVISHAVTKGLDPNVKMKDSGVEWLGQVPEHWGVMPLKHFVSMKSGEQITSDEIEETGYYPVYGGNGFRGFTGSWTHEGEYCLIGRQGALCGNINYAKGKFWASEHAVVVTPKFTCDLLFLGELLTIMDLGQYSTSAAQPGLSVEVIGNIHIPFPSLSDQLNIGLFLREQINSLKSLAEESSSAIRLLQERRSALISAAVTGQIDVRNFVPEAEPA